MSERKDCFIDHQNETKIKQKEDKGLIRDFNDISASPKKAILAYIYFFIL